MPPALLGWKEWNYFENITRLEQWRLDVLIMFSCYIVFRSSELLHYSDVITLLFWRK